MDWFLLTFIVGTEVQLSVAYNNSKIRHFQSSKHKEILKTKNFISDELIPILNERAGLPRGTELALWEEIRPNVLERLSELNCPLEKVVKFGFFFLELF